MTLPPKASVAETDPSMDDILASIRRILDDDQVAKEPSDDVLVLNPSMMVEANAPASPADPVAAAHAAPAIGAAALPRDGGGPDHPLDDATPGAAEAPLDIRAPHPVVAPRETGNMAFVDDLTPQPSVGRDPIASLVAPAAAAAAAHSVGALMNTLAAERNTAINRGGATIEDLVREEIRPLLKNWLDQHLAPMVERLVQVEIERLIARQGG